MHNHSEECSCGHNHNNNDQCSCGHNLNDNYENTVIKLILTFIIVAGVLFALKPFIVNQMLARASSYYTCSLYNDTVRICKKIIFIDNDNIRSWKMLGYSYKETDDAQKSAAAFEKAFNLNPNDKGAVFDLGTAYYNNKQYDEASKYFELIIQAGPEKNKGFAVDILDYYNSSLAMLKKCNQANAAANGVTN